MIEFILLNKDALTKYIVSEEFLSSEHIPITPHRAISHLNNPRANDEDVLLILAKQNGVLAGYAGILPDIINNNIRFGWLSCLWVSEQARGKNIGVQLIEKALEVWGNNLLSADYVPFTLKLYQKTQKFEEEIISKKGIRLYIKANFSTILETKHKFFKNIKPLISSLDKVINMILSFKYKKKSQHNFFIEFMNEFSDEDISFILNHNGLESCCRNIKDLLWINNNPWILEADNKNDLFKRYYFSSTSKEFCTKIIRLVSNEGNYIAIIFISVRDGHLKIPYVYGAENFKEILDFIFNYIEENNIRTLSCYNHDLNRKLKSIKTPAFLKKEITRNYLISKNLFSALNHAELILQDGDGDCAFT